MSLGLAALLAFGLQAQDLLDQPGAKSEVRLSLEQDIARPGDTVWAGLHLVIPEPWHTYWVNHGGVGEAPSVKWQLPRGVTAGKIHWPLPKKHNSFGSIAYVYEGEVLLLVPLKLAKDLKPGQHEIKAVVKWLECTDEACVQGEKRVAARFEAGAKQVIGGDAALFARWRERLPGVMPDLQAGWAGLMADNFWRPLAFRVPVGDAGETVEFFPHLDPKDEFMVQAEVKEERGNGYVKLTQQVESVEQKWPAQVTGVMRVGDKGYEVVLKVGEPATGSADKPDSPFLLAPGLGFGGSQTSQLELLLDAKQAKPGQTVMAGVRFKIPAGWHIYYKDPGGPGLPPEFTWVLPEGVEVGEVLWPTHEVFEFGGEKFNGYHDEVMLLVPLKLAESRAPGPLDLRVNVAWQECKDICVQGESSLVVKLVVAGETLPSASAAEIAAWQKKVPEAKKPEEATKASGKAGEEKKSEIVGAKTKVKLVLSSVQARQGDVVLAGVHFNIPPKWHIFWKNPGDLGEPPKIQWRLPNGVSAGDVQWPKHELYEQMGYRQNVYHDEVMLIVPLTLSPDLQTGELQLDAEVAWQECEISCVQGKANISASLLVAAENESSDAASQIKEWQAKVPASGNEFNAIDWNQLGGMLLLAFAGGLILNLMPCVLPVIALKVMGFVNQRKEEPGHARRLGIIYGLGVIFSFLIMAGLLLGVRAGAGGETWGMQMQNKWFLLFLTVLMTLVALNLFGVFEITLGGSAMTKADSAARKEGALGAFANGMLMVALATPCLAPMLGTAIGFALTQPAAVVALVFATVAVGLALPYVVLSFKPGWLRFLPQPGAWMESFKNAMGFPMLAAAIWLSTLAAGKLGEAGGLRVGFLMVLVAVAAWIFGQFIQRGTSRRGMAGFFALAASGTAAACLFVFQDKLDWKEWSVDAVAKARAAGHPVLIDFTADWCLTCKLNKRSSIEVDSVRKKIESTGTVVFKGDFTDKNPSMAAFIKEHGRPGVPLVLVYSPGKKTEPQILPELLTPGLVLAALESAKSDTSGTNSPPDQIKPDQSVPENRNSIVPAEISWGEWSTESVAETQAKGMPVLVDFTADWCAPCKHIEKTAINVPIVREKLGQLNVMTLKADFTDKGKVILDEMHRYGRPGPPLVLVYPPIEHAKPIVMEEVFTSKDLLKALDQAVGTDSEAQKDLESADASAKHPR